MSNLEADVPTRLHSYELRIGIWDYSDFHLNSTVEDWKNVYLVYWFLDLDFCCDGRVWNYYQVIISGFCWCCRKCFLLFLHVHTYHNDPHLLHSCSLCDRCIEAPVAGTHWYSHRGTGQAGSPPSSPYWPAQKLFQWKKEQQNMKTLNLWQTEWYNPRYCQSRCINIHCVCTFLIFFWKLQDLCQSV